MTTELLIRSFFILIIAAAISYSIFDRQEQEKLHSRYNDDHLRYRPYVPGALIPMYLVILLIYTAYKVGLKGTLEYLPALCFNVFLYISIYDLLLLCVLPLLRRWFSSRVCGALWTLPNFLYVAYLGGMSLPKPLLILHIPTQAAKVIFAIWIAGFVLIMLKEILLHFRFRHRILRNAAPVTDPKILEIWHAEQAAAGYKPSSCLVYSSAVGTPLTIGFFKRSVRVVLPKRPYTPEEFRLLFRHEIVHIGREDSTAKFFLVFCTAMCWFNPLMWIAKKRCSDDLELSCDETVLLGTDRQTRQQYAELLLQTAGDDSGFTSCLSNSAQALRYRLQNIMTDRKKFTGSILAGIVFFFLLMSYGHITFSFQSSSGREYIFSDRDTAQYPISSVTLWDSGSIAYCSCSDEASLLEYLADLSLCKVTGNYTFPDADSHQIIIRLDSPEGILSVSLAENVLRITSLYTEGLTSETYYCNTEIDWEYLHSLLIPR